jgi:hypothetical protein
VAQNPVAVEAELARLRAENARLLKLLRLSPQQAAPPVPGQAAFFEAPPGVVHHRSPQEAKVAFFGALFAARTGVYAVRYDNQRTGKSGWVPAVRGGWQKGELTPGLAATLRHAASTHNPRIRRPGYDGPQRHRATHAGTEKNAPLAREFAASGAYTQGVAGVGFNQR